MSRLAELPCRLPSVSIGTDVDAKEIAASFSNRLKSLEEENFCSHAVWRDVFALTGTTRTFYGPSSILVAWSETCGKTSAQSFQISRDSASITRLPNGASWMQCLFSFEKDASPAASCTGVLCLIPEKDGSWKIWTLRTVLDQLKGGYGDVDSLEPLIGANGAKSSLDDDYYDAVVVGGGVAGLSTAGRLKALGISYIVLDKNKEVGDNWKLRYRSTRLHTTREYAHLPFDRTFPKDRYQEFLTKDELAKGYQDWVTKFGVNVSLETTLTSGTWDPKASAWTLECHRRGIQRTIRSSYLVLAVGAGAQVPRYPDLTGSEKFKGICLHSVDYQDATTWKRKHGVIIGSANTAHDVAEDMVEAELASVTMVQRSRTYVLPYEYYQRIQDLTYNPTFPTELADMLSLSNPAPITRLISKVGLNSQAEKEPERFDALERAGFKLERYGDIMHHIYERFGRHYIDVGASAKISKGLIEMKTDAVPTGFTEHGLKFDNGDELQADVVVLATGFQGNLRDDVRQLLGPDIADQIEDFWGVDEEGELKGIYRPRGHPALYLHGGALGIMRYYSRFIALQIKAALLGTPLEVYSRKFHIDVVRNGDIPNGSS